MLEVLIFIFILSSIILLTSQLMPLFLGEAYRLQEKKIVETEKKLDILFIRVKRERLLLIHTLSPVVLALAGFIVFKNPVFIFAGVILGAIVPKLVLNGLASRRRSLFYGQLVDTLMILSSSLKGGLSLMQAFEVVVEEMPAPMKDEIGLVLKENKMGVVLEESLRRLGERMHLAEVSLIISSIMVARETGGDLTKVFSRLTNTIRDNHKLAENMKTLVLQGKLQGMIMSILPFVFVFWVMNFSRGHFDIMLKTDTGRFLLILAVVLQAVGMFLIKKFSTIKV